MLTEMDGLESRKGVYLMAATNRPGMMIISIEKTDLISIF